jgi:hypothetical protein
LTTKTKRWLLLLALALSIISTALCTLNLFLLRKGEAAPARREENYLSYSSSARVFLFERDKIFLWKQ